MEQKTIVAFLKNNTVTLGELCEHFNFTEEAAREELEALAIENIPLSVRSSKRNNELLYHIRVTPEVGNVWFISGAPDQPSEKVFAAGSDVHIASKFHLPRSFHETLRRVEDAGIKHVYLAGDVMDGVRIYRGHLENLVVTSLEDQTDLAAEALRKHSTLHFWAIAGNHDYSFTQQNGAKPLAVLEAKLDNFTNLGDFRADVIHDGIRVRLIHGGSGRAYAKSYPSQTYLRDYFSGLTRKELKDIPHVMILGHYHTFYNGFDHGIHILQPGSFQDGDNEYCIRRGLTGPTGLWLVSMNHAKGVIDSFTTEYYTPRVAAREKGRMHARNTRSY